MKNKPTSKKSNWIAILIVLVIITGTTLWQINRPGLPKSETGYFYAPASGNGILQFQDYTDSTLTVTYTLNGDTLTAKRIDRREFNILIRQIYAGKTDQELYDIVMNINQLFYVPEEKNVNYMYK